MDFFFFFLYLLFFVTTCCRAFDAEVKKVQEAALKEKRRLNWIGGPLCLLDFSSDLRSVLSRKLMRVK